MNRQEYLVKRAYLEKNIIYMMDVLYCIAEESRNSAEDKPKINYFLIDDVKDGAASYYFYVKSYLNYKRKLEKLDEDWANFSIYHGYNLKIAEFIYDFLSKNEVKIIEMKIYDIVDIISSNTELLDILDPKKYEKIDYRYIENSIYYLKLYIKKIKKMLK